ncbi:MAG: hypothetical protein ACPGJV_05945 [Bacteriovoracaceae bacterium]
MLHRENILHFFKENQVSDFEGHIAIKSDVHGPKIIVIGGTHGNEPAGVEAIFHVFNRLHGKKALVMGEIQFILGNPSAYKDDVRYLDYDLNRAFRRDGNEHYDTQAYEIQRSYEIMEILEKAEPFDLLIDLHSVSRGDEKILIYGKSQLNSRDFVSKLEFPFPHLVYDRDFLSGLLIEKAYERGALAFAVECGNHNSKFAHFVAEEIIQRSLMVFDMVDPDEIQANEFEAAGHTIIHDDHRYVIIDKIIPGDGFKFILSEEDTVIFLAKDQVYAQDEKRLYKAPEDCYLLMAAKNVKPSDVDAGFLCHRYKL